MYFLICIFAFIAFASGQGMQERCATDMVFLVDQSSSITPFNYNLRILPFLANLTEALSISQNGDHVAFVPFSDALLTRVGFHFKEYQDKESVIEAIKGYQYQGGNTATFTALNLTQTSVFDDKNGARLNSYKINIAPTLLIITDGRATDGDAAAVSQNLRKKGISVFAIGVGSLIDETYLLQLTGEENRVFSVSDYQGLTQELAKAIIESTTACGHRSGIMRN